MHKSIKTFFLFLFIIQVQDVLSMEHTQELITALDVFLKSTHLTQFDYAHRYNQRYIPWPNSINNGYVIFDALDFLNASHEHNAITAQLNTKLDQVCQWIALDHEKNTDATTTIRNIMLFRLAIFQLTNVLLCPTWDKEFNKEKADKASYYIKRWSYLSHHPILDKPQYDLAVQHDDYLREVNQSLTDCIATLEKYKKRFNIE